MKGSREAFRVGAVVLGIALLSASCVAAPGAMTEPPGLPTANETATASPPTPSLAASGEHCYRAGLGMRDFLTNSVVTLSQNSDLVVVGRVTAASETRWATADGREPVREEGDVPSVSDVYRIVTFQIERAGKTSPQAAAVIAGRSEIFVRAIGGEIGCKVFKYDDQPLLEVGQEVAVFLIIQPKNPRGVSLPGDFAVMWPWWIDQGKVMVPLSLTRLTVDEFIAQSLGA